MSYRHTGLSSLQRHLDTSTSYANLSDTLALQQAQHFSNQLKTFQKALNRFSTLHRNKILSNKEFRGQFTQLCNELGVDPLGGGGSRYLIGGGGGGGGEGSGGGNGNAASSLIESALGGIGGGGGGLWEKMLGMGDWYYTLGIQIVDVCLSRRERSGGLVGLEEVMNGVMKLRRGGGRQGGAGGGGGAAASATTTITTAGSSSTTTTNSITDNPYNVLGNKPQTTKEEADFSHSEISIADIKRAILLLDPLGAGYALLTLPPPNHQLVIQCSPVALQRDSLILVELCGLGLSGRMEDRGSCTLEEVTLYIRRQTDLRDRGLSSTSGSTSSLDPPTITTTTTTSSTPSSSSAAAPTMVSDLSSWTVPRVERAIESALVDGLVWIDDEGEGQGESGCGSGASEGGGGGGGLSPHHPTSSLFSGDGYSQQKVAVTTTTAAATTTVAAASTTISARLNPGRRYWVPALFDFGV